MDIGVDGKIILKWVIKIEYDGVGCNYVLENRAQWEAILDAVIGFRFHIIWDTW